MMHTEICRHAASVAEIACAAVNPVKKRHFYLAMKTEFNAATPMGVATGAQAAGKISTKVKLQRKAKYTCMHSLKGAEALLHIMQVAAAGLGTG